MQDDRPLIAMLEDDHERIARFAAVLSKSFRFLYWRTAYDFIANFPNIPKPELIALDHDLFVDHPGEPDPGDARDVSSYLSTLKPVAPVLIHSTNSHAADSMLYQFAILVGKLIAFRQLVRIGSSRTGSHLQLRFKAAIRRASR